jgi:taurine--2-oxoglutarate transaminase
MPLDKVLNSRKKLSTQDVIADSKKYSYFSWSVQDDVQPIVYDKAMGSHIWDTEGKKYIDLTSQMICTNIGHSHPHVLDAMKAQMDKLCFCSPSATTEVRARVSKKLANILPGDLNKLFYTLGGADSVENAIKISQMYSGKKKILTRYRSYHGGTYVASNAGGDPRKLNVCEDIPWMVKFHSIDETNSPLYKNMTKEQGDELAFGLLEQTVKYEGADSIAAIILEGYSGSSGIHNPGKKFFQSVRKLCTENNILFIADEVMSGFGRTGEWFGINNYDVIPDIMVMAKGLTSGYAPLGAVATNEKIADHFKDKNFTCGLTYSSHAVSLAACEATLEVYESENLIAQAKEKGEYLQNKFDKLKEKHPMLGHVRGTGLHWCLDFVNKNGEPLSAWNSPMCKEMVQMKTILKDKGLVGLSRWNWIFINPPLNIEVSDLDYIVQCLDEAITEVSKQLH